MDVAEREIVVVMELPGNGEAEVKPQCSSGKIKSRHRFQFGIQKQHLDFD
ncbi:MAG: hypothetical protein AAF702_49200 [Chloroflexota bacterium]